MLDGFCSAEAGLLKYSCHVQGHATKAGVPLQLERSGHSLDCTSWCICMRERFAASSASQVQPAVRAFEHANSRRCRGSCDSQHMHRHADKKQRSTRIPDRTVQELTKAAAQPAPCSSPHLFAALAQPRQHPIPVQPHVLVRDWLVKVSCTALHVSWCHCYLMPAARRHWRSVSLLQDSAWAPQ